MTFCQREPTLVKNYILDTNVLLHDPNSLLNFKDNHVLIPIEVVEEIDRFKRDPSELGQNARTVSRMLDSLRGTGRLSEGVALQNGGHLRILLDAKNGGGHTTVQNVDNRILAHALAVKQRTPGVPTVLVSKDINLRIKADAHALAAEDYETDRVRLQDLYSGMFERAMTPEQLVKFRTDEELPLPAGRQSFPNEYCTLTDPAHPKRPVLATVDATGKKLVPIIDVREGVWGIKPRNREQHFALDALLDDRIKLVTLMGKAGTGKTLMAMAAGLKRAVMDREFRRLVVTAVSTDPTPPCGACRQLLWELAGDIDVILASPDRERIRYRLSQLLPVPFVGRPGARAATRPSARRQRRPD